MFFNCVRMPASPSYKQPKAKSEETAAALSSVAGEENTHYSTNQPWVLLSVEELRVLIEGCAANPAARKCEPHQLIARNAAALEPGIVAEPEQGLIFELDHTLDRLAGIRGGALLFRCGCGLRCVHDCLEHCLLCNCRCGASTCCIVIRSRPPVLMTTPARTGRPDTARPHCRTGSAPHAPAAVR